MPLIVIEGVDGSGKTTLVNELIHSAPDDTRLKHCGPLKQPALAEYVGGLMDYRHGQTLICDRWHVGEMIYGPLYRGVSQVTAGMALYIELFLQSRGALQLHMDTPFEQVEHRLSERGEDFLKPEHLHMVMDFYSEYCGKASNKWQPVGPNYHRDRLPAKLLKQAAERDRDTEALRRLATYVGPRRPETLILSVDYNFQRASGFPAFLPRHGTSSADLFTALSTTATRRSYGILDITVEGPATAISLLQPKRLVVLGQAAVDKVASSSGGGVVMLQHPKDINLAYSDLSSYGALLRKAIDG